MFAVAGSTHIVATIKLNTLPGGVLVAIGVGTNIINNQEGPAPHTINGSFSLQTVQPDMERSTSKCSNRSKILHKSELQIVPIFGVGRSE